MRKYEFYRKEFDWAEELMTLYKPKWGCLIGSEKIQMLYGIC